MTILLNTLLVILFLIPSLVFGQEPSFDDQFVSSTEYTKIVTSLHDLNLRLEKLENDNSFNFDVITMGISSSALTISIIVFALNKKKFEGDSLLECIKILSNPDIKESKRKIAQKRRDLLLKDQPVIFNEDVREDVHRVREAYNQTCALYTLGLLNKQHFKAVYGGTVVTFWKIMKDDIIDERTATNNPIISKFFGEVAEEFIKSKVIGEPYHPYTKIK